MVTTETDKGKQSRDVSFARFDAVDPEKSMERVMVIATQEDNEAELAKLASWTRQTYSDSLPDDVLQGTDLEVILHMNHMQATRKHYAVSTNYVLRPGEAYVKAAMIKALELGLASNEEYFMVVEDDVVPSVNFKQKLSTLMKEGCGRYLGSYGGVVLLGSSDWGEDYWHGIDAAMMNEYNMCHDAHNFTMGAFAVLYNRDGASLVLEEATRRPNMPIDHSFIKVAIRGGFVSVAMPNLIIVDHFNKTSATFADRFKLVGVTSPDEEMWRRVGRNRWDVDMYQWAHDAEDDPTQMQ